MRCPGFFCLIPLLFALAAPAYGQSMSDGETLDRILPGIRMAYPGRLSDAQPWIDDFGRVHYRIKWMTPQGRILYFDADARTGRYSSAAGESRGFRERSRGRVRDDNGPIYDDRRNRGEDFMGIPDGAPGPQEWRNRRSDGEEWRGGRGGGDNDGWRRERDERRGNGRH